jgi:hypothetical protein
MSARQHPIGTFLRIALADSSFAYARLLESPYTAFYEYRTMSPDSDLDKIASNPILFKIAVHQMALNAWESIGRRALEEQMTQPVVQFMQDIGNFRRCTIFDTAGHERTAEPQECVGLERAAVWERSGVERRLLDTFMGRPNAEAERQKVRLS